MLYMATTDSIKFKAKSWIDVFGGRASKAVGSLVTNAFKKPVENLMFYGSLVSFCIASALLLIAAMLGSTFEKLSATVRLAFRGCLTPPYWLTTARRAHRSPYPCTLHL